MKMDSVYGSIVKENVLTLLKHMLATTGDIRFPSEWCQFEGVIVLPLDGKAIIRYVELRLHSYLHLPYLTE